MSESLSDIARNLPHLRVDCVVDVGANVGETVAEALRRYRRAHVYALEPVSRTYEKLAKRYSRQARVRCYQLALGAVEGEALITSRGTATGNRIVIEAPEGVPVEAIAVATGDRFVDAEGIDHISLLKIDTEGFDLDVLRGFQRMLSEQKIDLFQVEVSMGLQNKKHVDFGTVQKFAAEHGYWTFGIYNQTRELSGRPLLRRADTIFISENCAEANKRSKVKSPARKLMRLFR